MTNPTDVFINYPESVLKDKIQTNVRGSGILLHISSLPGDYGIGDLGRAAYEFVDFLAETGQKFWQILPLNPTDGGHGYSPYSSYSAFGGNTMFISPDLLLQHKIIELTELGKCGIKTGSTVDFKQSVQFKNNIFDLAFTRFQKERPEEFKTAFDRFLEQESYWIHDHALFVALKNHFKMPWHQWPDAYKYRHHEELEQFAKENVYEVNKEKFIQFLFHQQFFLLKKYCHAKNIRIFGDLPLYVNYDSVDVWTHPEYFKLDDSLKPYVVAGVPPDYFSETGQLWGMPIFNWERLKQDGYQWWVKRVEQNLKFFDLLRIDHFRGLSAYWEVSADEKTAINGSYKPGPAYELFNTLSYCFGELPFVAEDLGDIDRAVYELRDHYNFPGMNVLHFAFDENMPTSGDIPHHYIKNSVVYTGTHDNNTTKGWFRNLDKSTKKRLQQYTGKKITSQNCHNELVRLAFQSVSDIAIVPMQDILGLGEKAIMNRPSKADGNWKWKLKKNIYTSGYTKFLKNITYLYNR